MDIRPIFFIVYIIVNSVHGYDDLIVNTTVGTIRGVRSEDGQYNMFMGIPYAKVNESNPFGASIPPPYFDEIFEANDDSSMCPQEEEFNYTIVGDIDCLRLNVYTPLNVNSNSRLPVFVWIYGGGFTIGFYGRHMYGPKFLVRHDIILVTINYRLGPYGFMCLNIPEVPGNQGLKDQITGLRWIRSHISAFGGDPQNVTIGGNSAGSTSVDFHLHRDNSEEKLFHKAILQSGTTMTSLYNEPFTDSPIVLAKYLGFNTNDIYEALAFLSKVPPKDLVRAEISLERRIASVCLEKTFEGVENYLTTNWINAKIPAVNDMKILVGFTDDEVGTARNSLFSRSLISILVVSFNTQHEDFEGMTELVDEFYLGDDRFGLAAFDGTINCTSDFLFVHPTYRTIYKYIENNSGDIYLYNFSYVGKRNYVRRREHNNLGVGGAYHADEISYLFDMGFMPEEPTADDQLVIDKMTKMWANFVKYGDPTPELTELIDVKWKPIRPNSPIYSININTKLSLDTSPIADRINFWNLFYEKNGHLQLILKLH